MAPMLLESLLAYAHFLAILTLVVFVSSQAAVCRAEWLNAAVVRRLVTLDRIYQAAAVAVLLTGLARAVWGAKGVDWYWAQPLLHIKVTLFVVMGLMSIKPTKAFLLWQRQLDGEGTLPAEADIRATRRWIMIQAHIVVVIPLVAAMLARGVWAR